MVRLASRVQVRLESAISQGRTWQISPSPQRRENLPQSTPLLELGAPEPLSQLDAVHIFEQRLNKQIKLGYVPVEALETQHKSHDPLLKTLAALMLAYGKGDLIPGAASVAQPYRINLRSVRDYVLRRCRTSNCLK